MKSETKEGVLIIYLEGNLLGENHNVAVSALVTENNTNGKKKLIFNLAEMKFINSTGLGMIINAITKTRSAGGEVAFCNVPDQMAKLLKMTKLEALFTSTADEPSAIAYLNGL